MNAWKSLLLTRLGSQTPLSASGVARWYVALALLGVIPLTLLTPPLQVPDEQQHFFRAYQLSEGGVRSSVRSGMPGAELPSSLAAFADRFIGRHSSNPTEENLQRHREPLRETLEWTAPLDPARREFVGMIGAASYSPLGYAPQATGIVLARAFGAGPLLLLYAARLANGAAAILVVAAALRILPLGAMLTLVAALLPMTLFLFASASPDAAVISTAFLFTAVVMRARFCGGWATKDFVLACVSGAVFCSIKPPYAPLLAMVLPGAVAARADWRTLAPPTLLVLVVAGVTGLWVAFSRDAAVFREGVTTFDGRPQPVRASAQLAWLLENPVRFMATALRTVRLDATAWDRQLIGVLGWLALPAPASMLWIARGAGAAAVLLPRAPAPRISLLEAGWFALLLASAGLLVLTAMDLTFTPVGATVIDGVQGRYFLPLAPLAAVALDGTVPRLRLRWPTAAQAALPLLAINIVLTLSLVARYFDVL